MCSVPLILIIIISKKKYIYIYIYKEEQEKYVKKIWMKKKINWKMKIYEKNSLHSMLYIFKHMCACLRNSSYFNYIFKNNIFQHQTNYFHK